MTKVGIFVTVFDEASRVLCVRQNYSPFYWTTPGGKLETKEAPNEGAVREVYEETGCRIHIENFIGVYAAPFKDDVVLAFDAVIVGRDTWTPNSEISEIGFFDASQLPSPMKANSAERIADAVARRRGIYRVFATAEEHGRILGTDARRAG